LTGEIRMRRARRADIAEIIALLVDDDLGKLREVPGDAAYEAAFAEIDKDPNQLLAVAETDGAIAGSLQLTFIPGLSRRGQWRGQIEGVRVRRAFRGMGIGKAMIDWAIAQCRERGCGLVQLTSDKQRADAHRFYERLGFVASHDGMKLRF
jgi:ribosomal protein S18 acetylase RimI-like enzyme